MASSAAIPHVPARRSLRAPLLRVRNAAQAVWKRALSPAKPVLANLGSIPLTVIGLACVDFAAFHYIHMIGWAVTGASLFILEHLIADER